MTTNLSLNVLAVIVLADKPGSFTLDQADHFRHNGDWQYLGIDRNTIIIDEEAASDDVALSLVVCCTVDVCPSDDVAASVDVCCCEDVCCSEELNASDDV